MYPCPFYYACMQLQCIAILHPGQFLCASQSDEFNLFFEDNYMYLEYYVTTYIYWTIFYGEQRRYSIVMLLICYVQCWCTFTCYFFLCEMLTENNKWGGLQLFQILLM